jgi:hypothetical protein
MRGVAACTVIGACLAIGSGNLTLAGQQPTTPKQREHAKLFGKIAARHSKLTELSGTGDRVITHEPDLYEINPPETPLEFLTVQACQADAVLVGTFADQVSALTQGDTFIFTDLTLNIERVLKDNPLAPMAAGQAITVTRPGGELHLGNRTVRAELPQFRAFRVGGRYLLYLKFLRQTGDYMASGKGSFELRGERAFKLTPDLLWNESKQKVEQTTTLLGLAEKSVGGPCK